MAKAPKTTTAPTGQIAPFGLRMLPELREKIEAAAMQSGRSMNAEIVSRLQQTFEGRQDPDWQLRVALHTTEARLELLNEHELMLEVHIDALQSALLQAEPPADVEQIEADLEQSRKELNELRERHKVLLKEEYDLLQAKRDADREYIELLDKIADASMQSDLQAVHAFEERTGLPVGSRRAVLLTGEAKKEMLAAAQRAHEPPREAEKPSLEETKVVAGGVEVGFFDILKLAFSAGRESQENGTATKDLMKLLAIESPKKK